MDKPTATKPPARAAPVPEPRLVPARVEAEPKTLPEAAIACAVVSIGALALLCLKAAPVPQPAPAAEPAAPRPAAQADIFRDALADRDPFPGPARLQLRPEAELARRGLPRIWLWREPQPRPASAVRTAAAPAPVVRRAWQKLVAFGAEKRAQLERRRDPRYGVFLGTVLALAKSPAFGLFLGADHVPKKWPGQVPGSVPAASPANAPAGAPDPSPSPDAHPRPDPFGAPPSASAETTTAGTTAGSPGPWAGSGGSASADPAGLTDQAAARASERPSVPIPQPAPVPRVLPPCTVADKGEPMNSRCFEKCDEGKMLNEAKDKCIPIPPPPEPPSGDPLVFRLGANPAPTGGMVTYDLLGDGTQQRLRDIGPGYGVLAFDGNGDGNAGANGRELFGDRTDLLGGGAGVGVFKNGYDALGVLVLKAEQDGVIARGAWDRRLLEPEDLARLRKAYGLGMRVGSLLSKAVSLEEAGVRDISLSYGTDMLVENADGHGSDVVWRQGALFTRADGSKGIYTDLWLDYEVVEAGQTGGR